MSPITWEPVAARPGYPGQAQPSQILSHELSLDEVMDA
jgi:hypothetical protein